MVEHQLPKLNVKNDENGMTSSFQGSLSFLFVPDLSPESFLLRYVFICSRAYSWIHGLKAGESAFDNPNPDERPHKIVDGKIVENICKNRDKYTRQSWDRFVKINKLGGMVLDNK